MSYAQAEKKGVEMQCVNTRQYFCIDLKSFYASVECVERGLDPIKTNLVVADPERSNGTICLAVTPAMKKLGVKNRCRIFEIPKNIKYITAPPRMKKYIDYSAKIYSIYLRSIAKEDIHVYSIDEVFIDATDYLSLYNLSARAFAAQLMGQIYTELGIPAACGIGTNLYLCKVALDICAKKSKDFIAYLDEDEYRKVLWRHKPLTDFWRIGHGTQRTLNRHGIFTMEDIANTPEEYLYSWFGIDAELLYDHAFGVETATMKDIKAYTSKTESISSGQVLMRDYSFDEGMTVLYEMADQLALELVCKNVVAQSFSLYVGYSHLCNAGADGGSVKTGFTNSSKVIAGAILGLYKSTVSRDVPIRRINISANNVVAENAGKSQISFFSEDKSLIEEKELKVQKLMMNIKSKYGKNSIIRGLSLDKAATAIERNRQIGGHKSGEM